jgi:hypothetical protein
MHHAVNLWAQLIEEAANDGGVGAGGGEDKAADRRPTPDPSREGGERLRIIGG